MEHGAVPPLNPVCRKPAFMGFVACGVLSPAKVSVWRVVC